MDKLQITGGIALEGEVRISGAKNAALPIMCAALLSAEPLRLANVPHLRDVTTMLGLLAQMGIAVSVDDARHDQDASEFRISASVNSFFKGGIAEASIPISHRLFRYHSTKRRTPVTKSIEGRYPRRRLALEISAQVIGTSPG